MTAKPPRTPKFRRHSGGQGFVELNGRRIYLGHFDLPETQQRYHQAIAEWVAAGRQAPLDPDDVTVVELCDRFLVWAELYYRREVYGSQLASQARSHRRPGQTTAPRATERRLGEQYTTTSYGRAIARACDESGIDGWTPHRLRHTAATAIRKQFGLEGAQVMLGHATADVTQVYAEVNRAKALEISAQIG